MKVTEMCLFTNRNCLIFDENGEHITEYQSKVSCSHLDKRIALQATEEATTFYICKFREWEHEISRDEMQYLLGVHVHQTSQKKLLDCGGDE